MRVAVEKAKRVLTKEKIDRQRMGQSSTSPFLKVSQESKGNCEKGVTFNGLEIIERNSDSINKLTPSVNKMNIKMDEKEPQYKPRVYQGRTEDAVMDKIIIGPGKGHIVEIMLNTEEEEIIVTEVTGLTIELGVHQDQEMTMEMEGMTDLLIDKVT